MITKQICRRCGITISVLKDGFQFHRTDTYNQYNSDSDQFICPYCGAINEQLAHKYGKFNFTRKSIIRSTIYSVCGWLIFGFLVPVASISTPKGFQDWEKVLQQNYSNEMWSFILYYESIYLGLAFLNMFIIIITIKNRYKSDLISFNELMPIVQIISMLQLLTSFVLINLCLSFFIIPIIVPKTLVLNSLSVRLTISGITGALAGSWTHGMFFRECRK
jgi:hypothetical protein